MFDDEPDSKLFNSFVWLLGDQLGALSMHTIIYREESKSD
jgi:hypothetical protein